MSMITDMDQDEKIASLLRRVKSLERKVNGGNGVSKIINELIGQDCVVYADYENFKCRIMDADDEWVKLLVYNKKGDKLLYRRIDDISKIELEKWA